MTECACGRPVAYLVTTRRFGLNGPKIVVACEVCWRTVPLADLVRGEQMREKEEA